MQTYEALYIGSLPVPRAMGKRRCSPHLGTPRNPRCRGAAVPWHRAAPARTTPGEMGCPSPQGWMC